MKVSVPPHAWHSKVYMQVSPPLSHGLASCCKGQACMWQFLFLNAVPSHLQFMNIIHDIFCHNDLSAVHADGQPVWRAVSKPPAPKYTQQTDIALGGPFERSRSSVLPRANSTQQPRSVSRPSSRPVSAKTSHLQRAQPAPAEPQQAQQKQVEPWQAEQQQAEPQQAEPMSQPGIPHFQFKVPVAPAQPRDVVSPAEHAKSSGSYANDGRFASGFAQVRSHLWLSARLQYSFLLSPSTAAPDVCLLCG